MSVSTSITPGTANSGEFACIAAAWQAHHAELLRYLTHRLSDAATADDVLHDVFVKAMRQGQGFCTLDKPRAWLFQVARNISLAFIPIRSYEGGAPDDPRLSCDDMEP